MLKDKIEKLFEGGVEDVESEDLHQYRKWCAIDGHHPWSSSVLAKYIKEKGLPKELYAKLAKEMRF